MASTELQTRSHGVGARFSAAAATYDVSAIVQDQVAARVVELLGDLPGAGPILEIGCGTGLLTRRLAEIWPAAEIHALDVSSRMLEEAVRRCPALPRVTWIRADVRDYSSPRPYPLIVSSSALHWIEPLDETLSAVAALAGRNAFFVASFMLRDTLPELHQARRHVAPDKIPAARLADLDTIQQVLDTRGWTIQVANEETLPERHADARALLRSLHDRGVTGGAVSHSRYPLTRGELNRLRKYYDARYHHPEGGVKATYHVGLIKAVIAPA